jgi:phosphopantothenoylcysteine decarboxylase/phosphopantothenate--cysteine ligase
MAHECIARFGSCDIAILAAAVADFTPEKVKDRKIRRTGDEIILRLKPTQDIAETIGKMKKKSQILAGFALETHNELANATAKLQRKNLDIIIMNSMQDNGAGFGNDTNRITIIDRNNNIDKFELKSKDEAAIDILDKIVSMLTR